MNLNEVKCNETKVVWCRWCGCFCCCYYCFSYIVGVPVVSCIALEDIYHPGDLVFTYLGNKNFVRRRRVLHSRKDAGGQSQARALNTLYAVHTRSQLGWCSFLDMIFSLLTRHYLVFSYSLF